MLVLPRSGDADIYCSYHSCIGRVWILDFQREADTSVNLVCDESNSCTQLRYINTGQGKRFQLTCDGPAASWHSGLCGGIRITCAFEECLVFLNSEGAFFAPHNDGWEGVFDASTAQKLVLYLKVRDTVKSNNVIWIRCPLRDNTFLPDSETCVTWMLDPTERLGENLYYFVDDAYTVEDALERLQFYCHSAADATHLAELRANVVYNNGMDTGGCRLIQFPSF